MNSFIWSSKIGKTHIRDGNQIVIILWMVIKGWEEEGAFRDPGNVLLYDLVLVTQMGSHCENSLSWPLWYDPLSIWKLHFTLKKSVWYDGKYWKVSLAGVMREKTEGKWVWSQNTEGAGVPDQGVYPLHHKKRSVTNCFFFFFWDNSRFICNCKKQYR